MLTFLTSVIQGISTLLGDVDVNTPALVALGEMEYTVPNPDLRLRAILEVDIHCKAFVVGFISTAFTLLPFIVAYAGKHQLTLDPSKVILGLAKVSSVGGLVYAVVNKGSPLVREEYDRIADFVHPYIPMIVGSMGKGAYEPVFQEMQAQLGSPSYTPPFQGYKTGLSTPSVNQQSNWLATSRPSPAVSPSNKTPPTTRTETIVPAATPSGYRSVVVHEPPLIQVKEPDIGKTVCLTAYSPASDPQTVEVDIDDMEPIEEAEEKREGKARQEDYEFDRDAKGDKRRQEDYEFDRDALYDFDQP